MKKELKKNKKYKNDPFLISKFVRNSNIKKLIFNYSIFSREELKKFNKKIKIAGRIIRIRNFGKLIFADLIDEKEKIQLIIEKNKEFEKFNIGDILGIEGNIFKSQKGELSIKVSKYLILSKCFKSIPDFYYGLNDIEKRFRKRYLDFIVNFENKKIFFLRHKIIKEIRNFLDKKNFIEMETPILVSKSSGAQAKPFITYHNKLKKNFYLRIATEISLKKLLVAGFEKIYEIGKIFRNEGIDYKHNPEFTTIEIYSAYDDAKYMMKLNEKIFNFLSEKLLKKKSFLFNNHEIFIKKNFEKMTMIESIKKYTNINFSKVIKNEDYLKIANENKLELQEFQKNKSQIILIFFEKFVEKKLIQPTFIYDYPIEISPLAKSKKNDKETADRFELYIGGLEFSNGYSELNNPIEQNKRFVEQKKQKKLGNKEITEYDKDFIESLKYAMPPAGGLGIGIDRLIMLFSEKKSIKEVITFPQLKEL